MIQRTFVSLFLVAAALSATAIPAKPGLRNFTQSDGSTIEVRIIGDEFNHMYLTADGYPLIPRGRDFFHARPSADGRLESTGVMTRPVALRTAADRAFLAGIDTLAAARIFEQRSLAARPAGRNAFRAPGAAASPDDPSRFLFTNFPCKGSQKALVVLVEYTDVKFTLDDPYDYFNRMMNEPGFSLEGGTGSARDYFHETSAGQFDPEFDVFGPLTLSRERAYYGSNGEMWAWQMAVEACTQLDDRIDFADYDRDGDGVIDNIYIFFAGEGESSGGGEETVWPHAAEITQIDPTRTYEFDGRILNHYATSNEWELGHPDGVGTFVHEFSHVLGLPDLYTTAYSPQAFTPGAWSALDYGPYNNDGRTPPLYSAFERYCVGWLTPAEITGRSNVTLAPIGSNTARRISTGDPDEFFILENRQQLSWDTAIPGHGMLVWHIHFDKDDFIYNTVNNDGSHQRVDIIEADDLRDVDSRDGDSFPGVAGVTSITDDTTPSMRTWNGNRLSLPITVITETADGFIHFLVRDGFEAPAAPGRPVATDITSSSFTLTWAAVDGAADYAVTVAPAGKFLPVGGYDARRTRGATALAVSGLDPATAYDCYVEAIGSDASGVPSPILTVATAETGFADIVPVALAPTSADATSFTAEWQAVDGADSYLLDVYTKSPGATATMTVDFTGGIAEMPQGWSSTSKSLYNMASYAGAAVPALRMGADADILESQRFESGVRSLSFWHRGNAAAADGGNTIEVAALVGDSWTAVRSVAVTSAAGGVTTAVDDLPEGATAVRLTYGMKASGTVAIDDVTVGYAGPEKHNAIAGHDPATDASSTSRLITGLTPLTAYFYIVRAVSDGVASRPSNEIAVTTAATSAIDAATAPATLTARADGRRLTVEATPGATIRVHDATGRLIGSRTADSAGRAAFDALPQGVSLVSDGLTTLRLIIR